MKDTYFEVIRGAHGDGLQLFIEESVARESQYAGRKAYVEVPTEDPEETGSWDQNMLFVAEISGDFHCEDGGLEGFLTEKEPAVLYLEQSRYAEATMELEWAKVLYQNESYVLLANSSPDVFSR